MENLKNNLIQSSFKNGVFSHNKMRSQSNKSLCQSIKSATSFLPENVFDSQRAWHVFNNTYTYPLCVGGNERRSFISFNKGYLKTCHLPRFQCSCWNDAKKSSSTTMKKTNDSGKIKQSIQEKYDVDHVMQIPEVKQKLSKIKKETSVQWIPKIQSTMIERYGAKTTLESPQLKEQIKQTCLEKYGVENPYQSEEIKDRIKTTILEKYGVENPLQSEEIRNKFKQTCLERYGVENAMKSEEIRDKAKQTCLAKYGVFDWNQRNIPPIIFNQMNSQEWWYNQSSFIETKDQLKDILSDSTILRYARKFRSDWDFQPFISQPHQAIIDLLNDCQIAHETNTRKVIAPLELDIFIPSKMIAIEVNGLYWHSELSGTKDRTYHLNKTLECEKQGIHLLQFWDSEIENQWDIIKSLILSKLGIYEQRIGARKCKVIQVPSIMERFFLNENHLQGYRPSSVCFGLEYQDNLVSLMSFSKPRFSSKSDWELLRFCNKLNHQVIGGASKLFSQRPGGSLISYSDRRYSQGNLYIQLGMERQESSGPSYYYTKDYQFLENRMKYQKHKLPNILESYDPKLAEWSNMVANGYDRVWDCGNSVFKM